MLSHPPGRHHTGGGMTGKGGHGDTTEGGQHRGGTPQRGDVLSPLEGGHTGGDTTEGGQHRGGTTVEGGQRGRGDDIRGRWDNMGGRPPCPRGHHRRVGQHVVSPVSSPLTRVVPPSVWCLPGGWDNMWCPPPVRHPPFSVVSPRRVHVVSPCMSSPLTRVIPPSVWCLPGGWDNMWCPRACRPPSPASSPLQCGVSQEGGTTCGVPCHPPLPASSPLARVVPP